MFINWESFIENPLVTNNFSYILNTFMIVYMGYDIFCFLIDKNFRIDLLFHHLITEVFKNKPFNWTGKEGRNGTLLDWWNQTLKVPFKRRLDSLTEYGFDYPKYSIEEKKFLLDIHPLF